MKQLKTDVVIIGAGPSGMALALYLKRANISFILLEKDVPGGKLNHISSISNILGTKKIGGVELAVNMFDHLTSLDIDIIGEEVINIEKGFKCYTDDSIITSKIVVLAIGMSNKKINIPNYDRLFHKGISSCAICDGYLYKNKTIAVIGTGPIVGKELEYLQGITKKIIYIDNDDDEIVEEFIGKDHLEHIKTNKITYDVDGAFIYSEEVLNNLLIKGLDLKSENNHLAVDKNYMTSTKNVYAIGDVINKPLYQVVGALNDASIASVDIIKKLKHEKQ